MPGKLKYMCFSEKIAESGKNTTYKSFSRL